MNILRNRKDFQVIHKENVILSCSRDKPLIYVGYGIEDIDMYRGNFKINDYIEKRYPLELTDITETEDTILLDFSGEIKVRLIEEQDVLILNFEQLNREINRFWIRICADEKEHLYGLGEQMSYFDLRGRNFPIWTSEPGVGRDKSTYITWKSDVENKAGGDYYNTNFPQPTFVSSRHYYLHVETTAYSDFNFKNKDFHELQVWEVPKQIRIETADTYIDLLEKMTSYFGRQEELPDWVYNGLIIGAQGGKERVDDILEKSLKNNIKVSALWCQDWCGKRVTSFGKRLNWNWKYQHEMYPDLPEEIEKLHNRDIRFLGYINPYLVKDGDLYNEGKEKGYFAVKEDGSIYLVDFGEFYCGVVDLTNIDAYNWFKDIIINYSINIGIDGWMADFGEYLPTDDIKLSNDNSAMIEHNHWPVVWAKCNYEALKETGNLGKKLYFMRAGGIGTQKYCTLLWAGDQSVDFSIHDGLASVICGALSAGMTGCGLSHSDIGGYTSLFGNLRTKELFLRWAEMAMFTPVMRTHEGNRPDTNFQFYNDEDCMKQLARLVDIYTILAPYTKELVSQNAKHGTPVQRPLFLHYENDENSYRIQYEYLYGRDVLVAPVYLEDRNEWELYLPDDEWVHLWTGEEYKGGNIKVDAGLGYIPAFYRKASEYASIFRSISNSYGAK